jgi:hypothetical protein
LHRAAAGAESPDMVPIATHETRLIPSALDL